MKPEDTPLFYHVVMMRFTPEADDAFFRHVEDFAARIRASQRGLRAYHFGPNLADRSRGLTHAVIGVYDDGAAHDDYQASALHQEMKACMMPLIAEIVVCDFEV